MLVRRTRIKRALRLETATSALACDMRQTVAALPAAQFGTLLIEHCSVEIGVPVITLARMQYAVSGFVSSAEERQTLYVLIRRMGERALIEELAISRQSLGRVLAGLPVRRGTLALVRAGLATPHIRAVLQAGDGQAPAHRDDSGSSTERRST